jgi:hypothetical protein
MAEETDVAFIDNWQRRCHLRGKGNSKNSQQIRTFSEEGRYAVSQAHSVLPLGLRA